MPTDIFPIAVDTDDGSGYLRDTFYPPTTFVNDDAPDAAGVARHFLSPNYTVSHILLRWDTSSIADGASISAAELAFIYLGQGGSFDYDLIGQWYDFGGEPTVAADIITDAVYDAIAPQDPSLWGGAPQEIVVPIADLSGINKTGYTGLRLKLTGTTPTTAEYYSIAVYEHATHAPPELRVTYTVGEKQSFYTSRSRSWR